MPFDAFSHKWPQIFLGWFSKNRLDIYCINSGIWLDCSRFPVFSWDLQDIARLTVKGARPSWFSNVPRGRASEIMAVGKGGRENFLFHVSRFPTNRPRPLGSVDTHARWQPVTQSPRSRRSYGKIKDCEKSRALFIWRWGTPDRWSNMWLVTPPIL